MIRNWDESRCITCRVKAIGIISMILVGGFSVFYVVESQSLRMAGGLMMLSGLGVIALIKTCKEKDRLKEGSGIN